VLLIQERTSANTPLFAVKEFSVGSIAADSAPLQAFPVDDPYD
jgi:hypothetical protein